MSAGLSVRYSDVMQADRELDTPTNNNYDDSTLSVRDARRRFEQLSSPTSPQPIAGQRRSEGGLAFSSPKTTGTPPRPPPPRPLKKRATDPEISTLSTNTTKTTTKAPTPTPRGQRSSLSASTIAETGIDSSKSKGKTQSATKASLRKANSVKADENTESRSASPGSSDSKKPASSKKLFKKMNLEKGPKEATSGSEPATNGSANGRTKGDSSSTSSPSHKKASLSPLASMKKKLSSETKSNSQPSPPSSGGGKSLTKSFSDKVLASGEERSVRASLKDEEEGKVIGRSTSPRVIEDGELKLNLTQGKPEVSTGACCFLVC